MPVPNRKGTGIEIPKVGGAGVVQEPLFPASSRKWSGCICMSLLAECERVGVDTHILGLGSAHPQLSCGLWEGSMLMDNLDCGPKRLFHPCLNQ